MTRQAERAAKVGARSAREQPDRSALVDRAPLVIQKSIYDFAESAVAAHGNNARHAIDQRVTCDFGGFARPRRRVFSEVETERRDLLARLGPGPQRGSSRGCGVD